MLCDAVAVGWSAKHCLATWQEQKGLSAAFRQCREDPIISISLPGAADGVPSDARLSLPPAQASGERLQGSFDASVWRAHCHSFLISAACCL